MSATIVFFLVCNLLPSIVISRFRTKGYRPMFCQHRLNKKIHFLLFASISLKEIFNLLQKMGKRANLLLCTSLGYPVENKRIRIDISFASYREYTIAFIITGIEDLSLLHSLFAFFKLSPLYVEVMVKAAWIMCMLGLLGNNAHCIFECFFVHNFCKQGQ